MPTNSMGGTTPRREADQYMTPDALALAIAARVADACGTFDRIVEPSAGQGAFVYRDIIRALPLPKEP